jgi:hypothetical protein
MSDPTGDGATPEPVRRYARPPGPELTTRVWYLVAAGLIISAVTMAGIAFSQMMSTIEGMQRVVMPGRAEITLPAGGSTLYAEQESRVNGTVYTVSESFQYRCGVEDPQGGKVALKGAASTVTYSIGGFSGKNAWDIDVPAAGTYALVCEGGEPFVIAIGRGIGAWIVVGLVGLLPFFGGALIILLVFFKRRRQLRRARAAAPPA